MTINPFTDPAAEDALLQSLLDFDPLGAAEEIRGTSYKDDQGTTALGFALMQNSHQMRTEALEARDDTTFYNKLDRYTRIIEQDGFELVLKEDFLSRDGKPEAFFIYWHARDNLVLEFDTYQTENVNGGNVYYNWVPHPYYDSHDWYKAVHSGGFDNYDDEERRVWSGYTDCREALIFELDKLRHYGTFVNPWRGDARLWLAHHGDTLNIVDDPHHTKAIDRSKFVTRMRVCRLPLEVLEAISYCGECGEYRESALLRSCGYHEEIHGSVVREVICDDCEEQHNREV